MKIWRILTVICLISALVLCFAACGASNTEATTGAAVETIDATTEAADAETEPLVDPATFKDFTGNWYANGSSASYTLIIYENATWTLINTNGDAVYSGNLSVTDNNKAITLYDPDSIQVMDLKLEEAGKLFVEVYAESLQEELTATHFLNTVTNDTPNSSDIPEDAGDSNTAPSEDTSYNDYEPEPEEAPAEDAGDMDPLD